MSKRFQGFAAKVIGLFATLSLAVALPAPASAEDLTVDLSDFNLSASPALSYDALFALSDQICFRINTTEDAETNYKFKDLNVSALVDGTAVSVDLPTTSYSSWENQFMICTVNENWESLPEFSNPLAVTNLKLSGTAVQATTFSKSFENTLKSVGLSITTDTPLGVYYNTYNGSQFAVGVANKTKKVISVKLSNFKFEGKSLGSKSFTLILAPGATDYLSFGSLLNDVSVGYTDASVTVTTSKVTVAKVTRKTIKVPAGLQLVTTSPTDWYYYPAMADAMPSYNNTTSMCQKVKNTTKKPIGVESKFSFSAGSKKVLNYSGTSVNVIPAGETYCLTGAYDNRTNPSGDWRVGSAVTISGTLKVVKVSTLTTSGLVLPEGFTAGNSWFSYNASTKKTTATLVINAPDGFQGDLLISGMSFNGKTKLSKVAGPCQCGGPGMGNIRIVTLGELSGDQRIGKVLAVKGETEITYPTQLNTEIDSLWSQGCYAYYAQEWTYSDATGKTSVVLHCNNYGTKTKKLSLTGLTLTVTDLDGEMVEYQPTIKSITLTAKTLDKLVVMFVVNGDIRTGGSTVEIKGAIK
ncbi:MAG: hypothetical protein ACKOOE_00430 [Micrococcales bacterium]